MFPARQQSGLYLGAGDFSVMFLAVGKGNDRRPALFTLNQVVEQRHAVHTAADDDDRVKHCRSPQSQARPPGSRPEAKKPFAAIVRETALSILLSICCGVKQK
jgi:hypothetical protein